MYSTAMTTFCTGTVQYLDIYINCSKRRIQMIIEGQSCFFPAGANLLAKHVNKCATMSNLLIVEYPTTDNEQEHCL